MSFEDFSNRAMDQQRHSIERMQDQSFQQQLQSQTFAFQREQTDRFIKEYKETNQRLVEINESLQKQIDETKREAEEAKQGARKSSQKAWISIGIAGACGLLEVISIILKACQIL